MDEISRLEDKQKLTNLMIEKRFVQMEEAMDDINDKFGKIPVTNNISENVEKRIIQIEESMDNLKDKLEKMSVNANSSEDLKKEIDKTSKQIDTLKDDRKKEIEQISALVGSIDIGSIKREIIEMQKQVSEFKQVLDQEAQSFQMIENKVQKIDSNEKLHELFIKLKAVDSKTDSFGVRLNAIERERLMQPIFIE